MDTNTSNLVKYYTIAILGVLTPELLKKEYTYDKENPTKGFCYIASESAYHLFAKELGFKPKRARDKNNIVHWWLENETGEIIDITKSQYVSVGETPPYENGKFGGFLSKTPCRRTQIIINKIIKGEQIFNGMV